MLVGSAGLRLRAPGARIATNLPPAHEPPTSTARPGELLDLVGASEAEIRRRVDEIVLWFLADSSGSMFGQYGDPSSIRFAVALSLAEMLQRAGAGSCGVLHWGSDCPPELALSPVDPGDARLRSALSVPGNLRGTNLVGALERARELSTSAADSRRHIFFVLSDGVQPVTPEVAAAISALPAGSVHMLLVDRTGACTPAMEADWRGCPFGSFTRLTTLDANAMAAQLAETFASSVGLKVRRSPRPARRPAAVPNGPVDAEPPAEPKGGRNHAKLAMFALATLAALLILLTLADGHHSRTNAPVQPVAPAPASTSNQPPVANTHRAHPAGLSGVGMPQTIPGNTEVKPLRIVMLLGDIGHAAEVREQNALDGWLAAHANPATRITVLNRADTPTAVDSAFTVGRGQPLLVTLDATTPAALPPRTSVLNLTSRVGAATPTAVALAPAQTTAMNIDTRRPRALAATVARSVISLTHMTPR